MGKNFIPQDWKEAPVGEVFKFLRTHAISRDNLNNGLVDESVVGNIHYGDIHATYTTPSIDVKKQPIPLVKDVNFAVNDEDLLQDGDLIMADASEDYEGVGSTIAITGIGNKKIVGGLHTFVMRDRNNRLSKKFTQYIFRNPEIRNKLQKIANGVSVYGISKNSLSEVTLCLPPLPEQNRIVTILETWDQAIEKLTRKIDLKKNAKKELAKSLITGKIKLKGFGNNWTRLPFGELVTLSKKRVDPKKNSDQGICIELENIDSGTGRLLAMSDINNVNSLKSVFNPGDVLFGKLRAYLKKYWFADRTGFCSTEIWVLQADRSKIIPEILYQIVQSDRFIDIASAGQGTHMPRASWDLVSSLQLSIPDLTEQKAIADVLVCAEKEIFRLEERFNILKQQKNYLLNNLITGKIRTTENLKIMNQVQDDKVWVEIRSGAKEAIC